MCTKRTSKCTSFSNINKSSFFLFTNDTKLKYTPIPDDFTKETIYLAFIKYCKFNSGVTLSKDLNRVCINNSCNFKAIEPIHEKIAAMEADSLNYSKESLRVLLNIINRRNILEYDLDPPVTTEKLFLEHSIEKLEEKDGIIICHPKLIEYLKKIVDRFDVSIQGEDDPIVLQFTSYLKEINRQMSVKISEKMIERGELTPALKDLLIEYSQEGSVGASGDLAPLGHMALVLIGEGEAFFEGKRLKSQLALKKAKIKPLSLKPLLLDNHYF